MTWVAADNVILMLEDEEGMNEFLDFFVHSENDWSC